MIYAKDQKRTAERASMPFEILLARLRGIAKQNGTAPIVGVTSCREGEGVSTMAMSLAMTAAELMPDRRKKVLLVDANSTAPALQERFHLTGEIGFSDVLTGRHSLESALQSAGTSGLQVLVSGSSEEPEQSDLNSTEQFWQVAREEFRLVVLDLPCAARPHELLRYLGSVDQVLLVVESGRVGADTLLQTTRFLKDMQGREPWTVLNKWQDPIPRWLAQRLS